MEAIPHSYRAKNGMVLVAGTMRLSGSTGLVERTAYWLYWLQDGKLLRVEGCSSLAEGERVLAAQARYASLSRLGARKGLGPALESAGPDRAGRGQSPRGKRPSPIGPAPSAGRSFCVTGSYWTPWGLSA